MVNTKYNLLRLLDIYLKFRWHLIVLIEKSYVRKEHDHSEIVDTDLLNSVIIMHLGRFTKFVESTAQEVDGRLSRASPASHVQYCWADPP